MKTNNIHFSLAFTFVLLVLILSTTLPGHDLAFACGNTEELHILTAGKEGSNVSTLKILDQSAHDNYLKGREFWKIRTKANLDSAMHYFDKAIKKDPDFAKAWSGRADTYLLHEDYYGTPYHIFLPKAREAAEKALKLDPTSAEAHTSMGMVLQKEFKYNKAKKEFEKAIALNPQYALTYHWLALNYAGQHELTKPKRLT